MPNKKTVLMIDDDEIHLEFATEVLQDDDLEVITHFGGLGVLPRVRTLQPDLILLDVNMPDVSGEELAHQLRNDEQTKHIRIVFYSSNDGGSLRKLVSACKVHGYICKGNIEEFRSKVRHYLTCSQ